jgi:hypothetical protein
MRSQHLLLPCNNNHHLHIPRIDHASFIIHHRSLARCIQFKKNFLVDFFCACWAWSYIILDHRAAECSSSILLMLLDSEEVRSTHVFMCVLLYPFHTSIHLLFTTIVLCNSSSHLLNLNLPSAAGDEASIDPMLLSIASS